MNQLFKTIFLGANLILAGASVTKAAVIIADWTFEGTEAPTTATSFTYGAADSGSQTGGSSASGLHASSSTSWSFTGGNPSPGKSLSADHWAVNDYFQFSVSTAGYNQITVAFDAISSGTGPADFHFEYSADNGANFTVFNDFTITHTSFTVSSTTFNEDLSSISGLNDDSSVVFRLVDGSTTSESGSIVGTSGATHVDNFIISGTAVPEPAAWGAFSTLGLLGICGLREWRLRRQ